MLQAKQPMQLIHITPSIGRQSFGLGAVALDLVLHQQKLGLHSGIWCSDEIQEAKRLECEYELQAQTIKSFPIFGPHRLSYSPKMEKYARQWTNQNAIVHQHGIWTGVSRVTNRLRLSSEIPTVVAPHGSLDTWTLKRSSWKKTLALFLYERSNLQNARAIHALTPQEAVACRSFGLRNAIAIIPNGISGKWTASLGEGEEFRIKHNVSNNTSLLLFLGRVTPKKGLPLLIGAMHKLRSHIEKTVLVVAGVNEFGHQQELELLVRQLDLSCQVMFVGPLHGKDKRDAFAAADVFVLPSYSEGAPVVILEALGAGVPVITTKASPWEELITHGCGWWTDSSVDAIADALLDVLPLPQTALKAMGQRGKQLVNEKYTWSRIAEQTIALYDWLLNGGEQPEFIITE